MYIQTSEKTNSVQTCTLYQQTCKQSIYLISKSPNMCLYAFSRGFLIA